MDVKQVIKKTQSDLSKLKSKYPTKIPVIVNYLENNKTKKIIKLLSEKDNTPARLLLILRDKVDIKSQEGVFLFYDDKNGMTVCPNINDSIDSLKMDILVFTMIKENVFGDEQEKKNGCCWIVI